MLLSLYEGQTIGFEAGGTNHQRQSHPQRIHAAQLFRHEPLRPDQYYQGQMNGASEAARHRGRRPVALQSSRHARFPDLTDDTILKPRLEWVSATDKPGKFPAEFSYVTGGMTWQADYNIVAPEKGDVVDIVGWVTMDNQTGKTFENARIKLMAGDVNKIQPGMGAGYANVASGCAA
jgi:hypothetical protein